MTDNRNTILAVILSGLVPDRVAVFLQHAADGAAARANPGPDRARQAVAADDAGIDHAATGSAPSATTPAGQPGAAQPVVSRDAAIAASPRIKIETPRVSGSIALKGARIDDLSLEKFRDTVDPKSPAIVLFSPFEHRRIPIMPSSAGCRPPARRRGFPTARRYGSRRAPAACRRAIPVTLKYDNGEGLTFRRTIAIDDRYLFTVKDDVTNVGSAPVTLYPFALIRATARLRSRATTSCTRA
jgi:YidC/Oxa1 family membrane protein insertase